MDLREGQSNLVHGRRINVPPEDLHDVLLHSQDLLWIEVTVQKPAQCLASCLRKTFLGDSVNLDRDKERTHSYELISLSLEDAVVGLRGDIAIEIVEGNTNDLAVEVVVINELVEPVTRNETMYNRLRVSEAHDGAGRLLQKRQHPPPAYQSHILCLHARATSNPTTSLSLSILPYGALSSLPINATSSSIAISGQWCAFMMR